MQTLEGFVWFCVKLFSLSLDPASHRHLAQVHLRQAHPGQAGEVLHEEWRRPRAHRGPHKRPHVDACWFTLKPRGQRRSLLTYDPLPWLILMLLLEKIYDYTSPKNTVMLTQPPPSPHTLWFSCHSTPLWPQVDAQPGWWLGSKHNKPVDVLAVSDWFSYNLVHLGFNFYLVNSL